MSIGEFIQRQVILPRLQQSGVLVVYDPARRYRELCVELASDKRRVVDASESSIEGRAEALEALQALGQPNAPIDGLLIYVPAHAPLSDEQRQRDPFALYAACGAVFPDPANDGDEYLSLCLKAKADHVTEIRRIFQENPNPSFAVIDAVGGGAGWPNLQAVLGVESAREILFALLAPEPRQLAGLKSDGWVSEAKELASSALGLQLTTRGRTWEPVTDELWRFLLFSEFVLDLPAELPAALANVPRAPQEAWPLVRDLCERLRSDVRTRPLYIERAEEIERALGLVEACRQIDDLGQRDTFPFEERSFFSQATDALTRDNVDRLRQLLGRHERSVWASRGENQVQWLLLQAATALVEACDDADRQLPDHVRSQDALIDFYVGSLREVDRLQRELEQAAGDYISADGQLLAVLERARTTYQRLVNRAQAAFVRHLEKSGWPVAGRLANADMFDRVVAPMLQQSGHRVVLFMIDALRYELGIELKRRLGDDVPVDLQPALAQLPSITPVGMASLLPGAGQHLRLTRKGDDIVPALGDQPLANVSQRMELLRRRYGQRFAEMPLGDFVRAKAELPETVELLVLRSNELDSHFEANPETAPSLISRTFQQIAAAIRKLRERGFQDAVIATDHGFFLNTAAKAGDVCGKPPGRWVAVHDRMLLGDGTGDSGSIVLSAEQLGIRGDFAQAALPRALVPYRHGQTYFHGGASLQEAIVPVLSVRLSPLQEKVAQHPKVELRYRNGARRITTRLPVITIDVGQGDMFWEGKTFEVLLEAHDRKGTVVGEARPGGPVNAANRTITLTPNTTVQVTLKMDDAFEGKFSVKALDPTTLTAYHTIDLETDYTV